MGYVIIFQLKWVFFKSKFPSLNFFPSKFSQSKFFPVQIFPVQIFSYTNFSELKFFPFSKIPVKKSPSNSGPGQFRSRPTTSNQCKHRKNCECYPVSLLIVRSQWLSWSQVLNCLKCKQFHIPCHVSVMVSVFVFVFVFVTVWVIVIWLVRSCIIITLIICLKGHKSLWSLFECVL